MNERPSLYHYQLGLFETFLMEWSEEHRQLLNSTRDGQDERRILVLNRIMRLINE